MKATVYHNYASPDVLGCEEIDKPTAGDNAHEGHGNSLPYTNSLRSYIGDTAISDWSIGPNF